MKGPTLVGNKKHEIEYLLTNVSKWWHDKIINTFLGILWSYIFETHMVSTWEHTLPWKKEFPLCDIPTPQELYKTIV